MKKRVITFLIALLVLSSTLVVAVGARTVGSGWKFRPYINYTVTTDYGVTFSPPTVSENNTVDTFRLNGGGVTMSNVVFSTSDTVVIHGDGVLNNFDFCFSTIKYDFDNALVTDENGDIYPPDITGFDIRYDPFAVMFTDMFELGRNPNANKDVDIIGIPFFDNIKAVFRWGGGASAYVSSTVRFRLSYVESSRYTAEGYTEYGAHDTLYELFYSANVTDGRFDSDYVSLSDVSIRNVTNDVRLSLEEFMYDVIAKTSVVRTSFNGFDFKNIPLDVEDMTVSIYAQNAPFTYLTNETVFITEDGYKLTNGLQWDEDWGYRQQHWGGYLMATASEVLNRRALNDYVDSEEAPSTVASVVLLFLGAVSDFFAIDFFGLGFTIGNLIGILSLCAVVLIFLKFFAGG